MTAFGISAQPSEWRLPVASLHVHAIAEVRASRFGSYHYRYDSGREGGWFVTGFSPRKGNLTLYIMAGFDRYPELLERLGKFKTGKSCLYVKKLADVDEQVLVELIAASVDHMRRTYEVT